VNASRFSSLLQPLKALAREVPLLRHDAFISNHKPVITGLDPDAMREARDRSLKSPRWSAGRRASPVWDARRLARCLACRVTCRPNGCLASTRTSLGAPPPLHRGSEAKVSNPGRKKRAAGTRRCCLVLTLSARHSGRAATAARAGIHNHRPWVWIPGSQASPAPRNDAEKTRRGNEEVLLGANAFSSSFRPSRDSGEGRNP